MSDLAEQILDYASSKARYAEVRHIETSSNGLHMRDGIFQGAMTGKDSGYMIRVVNSSIGIGFSDSDDFSTVRKVVDTAIRGSERAGKNAINTESYGSEMWSVPVVKKPEDVSVEEKISMLRDRDRHMESLGCNVRINFIADSTTNQKYLNSNGSRIEGSFARVAYFYMFGIIEGSDFEQSSGEYGSTSGYEYIDGMNFDSIIEEEYRTLKRAITAHTVNPGKMDLIVGPEISGIVAHESAGHPTEYDRIIGREGALAGESFLTFHELPLKVGSEAVSVVDDPTMPGSYGHYKFDDEGVRAARRYLYKKGTTDEFIHNRESAEICGTSPNGGGRSSSWDMEPLPRMSTTYIEPGDYSFEELIEDIRDGIYIKSYTEWNIDDIRFNEKYVGKEAHLIKNGELTDIVRKPVIETNTINFYSSIDAVGKNLSFSAGNCGKGDPEQAVPVWMGGPDVRLKSVYIK